MSLKFITGVLAIAATITAFASAPARADNDDLKRFVGAAATLYLLGKAIEHNDGKGVVVQSHGYGHGGHGYKNKPYPGQHGWNGNNGFGKPKVHAKPALPRVCLVRVNKQSSTYALKRRCMANNYRAFNRLPKSCAIKLNGAQSNNWGYALRCLRRNGYELASR